MPESPDTPRQEARLVNGPKELLTVGGVADFLRVRPSMVYQWAKHGRIPPSKVSRLSWPRRGPGRGFFGV
jgi:hypothetical protein